ncbi:MAG: hypothetical protein ACOC93_04540 [Planctomycetota bacterium]
MPRQNRTRKQDDRPTPQEPVDQHDGVPDRAGKPSRWVYPVIVLIFVVWLGILLYVQIAG